MKQNYYQGFIPFDKDGNQLSYQGDLYVARRFEEWDTQTKTGKTKDGKIECLSSFQIEREFESKDEWERKWGLKYEIKYLSPFARQNAPFEARLRYKTYGRGRSAAYFVFEDDDNKQYNMFMCDLDDLVRNRGLPKDGIQTTWVFTKKGQNFGVKEYVN